MNLEGIGINGIENNETGEVSQGENVDREEMVKTELQGISKFRD